MNLISHRILIIFDYEECTIYHNEKNFQNFIIAQDKMVLPP